MKKKTNNKMPGCVISVNDDTAIIQFSGDVSSYRSGQHVIVSVPRERKTALGKVMNVAEIIAYGKISNIANAVITIQSNRSSPIISKSALRDSSEKEHVMFVETLN